MLLANEDDSCSCVDADGAASAEVTERAKANEVPLGSNTTTQAPKPTSIASAFRASVATVNEQDEPPDTGSSDAGSESADSSNTDGGGLVAGARIGIAAGIEALALLRYFSAAAASVSRTVKVGRRG